MVALADRDRGQLVLVGAVVVAIAIVALVVVLNTVLYTANVTTTGGVASAEDAESVQQLVDRTLPALVGHSNRLDRYSTPAAARQRLRTLLRETSRSLSLAKATNSSASVYLNASAATMSVGALVIDENASDGFVNASGNGSWTMIPQGTSTPVRFRMTLDAADLPNSSTESSFALNVTDDDGGSRTLTFDRAGTSHNVFLDVEGGASYKLGTSTVTVDLISGEILSSEDNETIGSDYDLFDGDQPRIAFENGENVTGTYRVLFDDAAIQGKENHTDHYYNSSQHVGSPLLTYVVRNVSVPVTYASPELTTTTNFETTIPARTTATHLGPRYRVHWQIGDVIPNGYGENVTLRATADVPQSDLRLNYTESNATVANVTVDSGRTATNGTDLVNVTLGARGVSRLTVEGTDDAHRIAVQNYALSGFENGSYGTWNASWLDNATHVSLSENAAHTGESSLALGGDGENMSVISSPYDTSSAGTLLVDVWAQDGSENADSGSSGPEATEDDEYLLVEYRAENGTWVTAGRLDATEDVGEEKQRRFAITDPGAMYRGVRFRLRMPHGDNSDDIWYVDDVRITGLEEDDQ